MTRPAAPPATPAADLPFGTEVPRPRWPMTLLWTLYFLCTATLVVLAILRFRGL